jgi:hypothetical protein
MRTAGVTSMFNSLCRSHVEDTEETLITSLELSVVENLDSNH